MKRMLLICLAVSSIGLAMQKESPLVAKQVKKETDAKSDQNAASVPATSSSVSNETKKSFLARCFVCCNGKAEAK